ncbi:MAG: YceI family protein [Woeseiaceae bacterium]
MKMMRILIAASIAASWLAGCGQSEPPAGEAGSKSVPSGIYAVDRLHTYLSFSYLHQGLSYPLLRATDVMGELQYDGDDMTNSKIDVSVAADSIRTNVAHFDKELASRKFFNAQKFPHITFTTDRYEPTNDSEGILHGDVTIRGISKPIEFAVTFNDGFVHPVLEVPVLGFSATGSLSRSDFGLDRFVPVVSDTVVLNIEIEFRHGSTDESAAAAKTARNEV